MTPNQPDTLISLADLMKLISVSSRTTVYRYLDENPEFPRPCKIGGRRGGAVIMVDEASQVGTERLAKLIDLANRMDVGRLVLAGDTRQLQAIEAGKPFVLLQKAGQPTSTIAENLRATSPQMRALNAALEQHDLPRAFDILRSDTIEVPFASGPAMVARLWVDLPPDQREKTLLLASGRAMRSAANTTVQEARFIRGELAGKGLPLTVLDRVTITREGARQKKGYRDGRLVEFRTNLPSQGIHQGDRGVVQGMDKGQVVLAIADGSHSRFEPDRLPRNLAHNAVTIYEPKQLPLFGGDRIRWTDNDRERGLLNGDMATIERAEQDAITIRTQGGERLQLSPNDPMREKLDLAYAVNVHIAQGKTATNGIILMSEREKQHQPRVPGRRYLDRRTGRACRRQCQRPRTQHHAPRGRKDLGDRDGQTAVTGSSQCTGA